ncbi:Putative phosphatase [Granulibacter bethesdensis]|uniref:phosphoglycolate phosphatase n=1 Tax=Granulibacter bethesdensis TaxID=364410 RepID=A0AAC9K9Y6_9PROT|nr:HAD family hydrolase [Granulibacter bethesdensis]APH54402.1 Putative phosphatase [Granulibacter bethesdensis]APH61987.1 Putative phosphatase [Granulibacter bethesdensis]
MTDDRPDAILWDWDNTLIDGWAAITAALNAVFRHFGRPVWTVMETKAQVRGSARDTFPTMFGVRWEEARDIFYGTLSASHLDHLKPMPGAEAMLRAASLWPQAVVSNKAGDFLRREVAYIGWEPFFGAVIGAGDAAADKPAAAPILLALERMRYDGERSKVWYIGDTALDMQAARAAGCTAILLGDAAHDGGIARAAFDHHIQDGHALAAMLNVLHGRP